MKVLRSEVMGFCSGVSRAVKMAEDALEQNSDSQKKIYSLGPLIHNEAALSELARRGLKILEQSEIPSLDKNCVVLIRAHGVAPKILEQITATGATIIDATCPRVALSQRRAAEFSAKGYAVFLAGDAGHGEVEAVKGSAGERFVLLSSQAAVTGNSAQKQRAGNSASAAAVTPYNAAREFVTSTNVERSERAVLLSQTTFSPDEFKKIAAALCNLYPSLEVLDTICPATQKRQQALLELAKKADAIIVVGGKKSANTRRLYDLSVSLGKKTFFAESAAELPLQELRAFGVVGITAGASTSDSIIDEVERAVTGSSGRHNLSF